MSYPASASVLLDEPEIICTFQAHKRFYTTYRRDTRHFSVRIEGPIFSIEGELSAKWKDGGKVNIMLGGEVISAFKVKGDGVLELEEEGYEYAVYSELDKW